MTTVCVCGWGGGGIQSPPVNFPHKGQWRGALVFYLICAWINDGVNNREASDLIHHRAHYDVTVMFIPRPLVHRLVRPCFRHELPYYFNSLRVLYIGLTFDELINSLVKQIPDCNGHVIQYLLALKHVGLVWFGLVWSNIPSGSRDVFNNFIETFVIGTEAIVS